MSIEQRNLETHALLIALEPLVVLPNAAAVGKRLSDHPSIQEGVEWRAYVTHADGSNRRPVDKIGYCHKQTTISYDTIYISGLTRGTEYRFYIEYTKGEYTAVSSPLVIKTPNIILDDKKFYDNFRGYSRLSQVCLIESNEFALWSYGEFPAQSKVEFVDRANPNHRVPLSFRIDAPDKLICTVPENMTDKSVENYELAKEYSLEVNGEAVSSIDAAYSRRKDRVYFKVHNNAPLINKVSPDNPLSNTKKLYFEGYLFDFSILYGTHYLNVPLHSDKEVLWITQGNTTKEYPYSSTTRYFWRVTTDGPRLHDYVIHSACGVQIDRSLFTVGENTIWIDFYFGEKVVSTNKFTFNYQ